MGIKNCNSNADLLERYINTSYDKVKIAADNIDAIIAVNDSIEDANFITNATNISDIVTVATNIADVNTVALNETDVQLLADHIDGTVSTDITVVADNITDVNIVEDNITDINLIADHIDGTVSTDINIVADNITDINTVEDNLAAIHTVNSNQANIDIVANRDADVAELAIELNQTPGESFVTYVNNKVNQGLVDLNITSNQTNVFYQITHPVTANGLDTFALPGDAIDNPAFIHVYINGIHQDSDAYTLVNGQIVLDEGLDIGDSVTIHTSNALDAQDVDTYLLNLMGYSNEHYTHTLSSLTSNGAVDNSFSTTAIDLNNSVFNGLYSTNSLVVFVNGVYQALGTSYIISGGDRVVFTDTLESTDVISFLGGKLNQNTQVPASIERKAALFTVPDANVTVGVSDTIVDLTSNGISYNVDNNELIVFVNGVCQEYGTAYIDYSSTQIKLTEPLETGDTVFVYKTVFDAVISEVDLPPTAVLTSGSQTVSGKTLSGTTLINAVDASGATWSDLGIINDCDIDGGSIDGTIIGANTPANGTFSTLTSANAAITGGSVKGTVLGDAISPCTGTFGALTLKGNVTVDSGITIDGVDISSFNTSYNNHTGATSVHGISGNVVGTTDTQTLTNKTLDTGTVLNQPSINTAIVNGHINMNESGGATPGIKWLVGTGSPESVVTADVGSLYTRIDGGANTTLYVKESGSSNTGWVAK